MVDFDLKEAQTFIATNMKENGFETLMQEYGISARLTFSNFRDGSCLCHGKNRGS